MPMRSSLLRARHDKRRRCSSSVCDASGLLSVACNPPLRRSSFTSIHDTTVRKETLMKYRSKSSTTISDPWTQVQNQSSADCDTLSRHLSAHDVTRRASYNETTLYVPNRKQQQEADKETYRIKKINVAMVMFVISSAMIGVAVFAYWVKTYK